MPRYSPAPYIGPPKHYGNYQTEKHAITIHATANNAPAIQEAAYAETRPDSVSSHFYVDANTVIQSLDTSLVAWHAGSEEPNEGAVAIEITGRNEWSTSEWRDSVAWSKLVDLVVWLCQVHDIVPGHPSVGTLQAIGPQGIFTHDDARRAWGGTDHTDPGPNFPLDWLLDSVRTAMGHTPTPDPAPQEDDDMPAFQTGQLNKGLGVEHTTMLAIPPVAGGAGWGPAWLSFGADFGSARLRVAVHVDGHGWTVQELNVTNDGNRTHWAGGGELPAAAGKVSIIREALDPTDTGQTPVAWLLEYGRR